MHYLITGGKGLLGSTFLKALGTNASALTREDLSSEKSEHLLQVIAGHSPNFVINCAAHVNAEQAEQDIKPVYEANVELPYRLARACYEIGVPLVHFSSTGCYGSWKQTPYLDEDLVKPTTAHHKSKVEGEEAIRAVTPQHLILRTGWLFGGTALHKKNFVWQRILEAFEQETLASDQTQRGCPTWTDDVVAQTCTLLSNNVRGTLNCVGAGTASRYEYVTKIVELFEIPCKVIPSGSFKRRAAVSPNEMALNNQMQLMKLDQMPHWVDSLSRYKNQVILWPEWHHLMSTKRADR
jgi:dTDP-4-dehydrorhamnose reductase